MAQHEALMVSLCLGASARLAWARSLHQFAAPVRRQALMPLVLLDEVRSPKARWMRQFAQALTWRKTWPLGELTRPLQTMSRRARYAAVLPWVRDLQSPHPSG